MNKSHIQKGAVVIVVLLLFIGFIQYRDYKNTHFAVDTKTFSVKSSMDDIIKEAYKENPQLEGAFKYGIGENVNIEIPLVSERREMRIDKVWISPGMVYLFYSVNLLKGDKTLKNIPAFQAKTIIFHRDNGPDFEAKMMLEDFGPPHKLKMTYNDQVYQELFKPFQFENLDYGNETQMENFQKDFLNHVTGFTLADAEMVLGKKKIALKDIKIPVGFNMDKYLVKTIPVNKELQLGKNKVTIKNYKKYFNHGELTYTSDNGAMKNILSISADVKVKGGSQTVNWNTEQSIPKTIYIRDGKQYFPSIGAESMTITPKEYGYRDSHPIHFRIDKAEIKKLQANHDSKIKIADIKNGSIYLSIVDFPMQKGFSLTFKYDKGKYPHVGEMNWITTSEVQNMRDRDSTLMFQNSQVIDIKDDKGHLLSTFNAAGVQNDTGQDTYIFDGGVIDWFDFSGLDITLQSLVYMNKISTEPITIPLGK